MSDDDEDDHQERMGKGENPETPDREEVKEDLVSPSGQVNLGELVAEEHPQEPLDEEDDQNPRTDGNGEGGHRATGYYPV